MLTAESKRSLVRHKVWSFFTKTLRLVTECWRRKLPSLRLGRSMQTVWYISWYNFSYMRCAFTTLILSITIMKIRQREYHQLGDSLCNRSLRSCQNWIQVVFVKWIANLPCHAHHLCKFWRRLGATCNGCSREVSVYEPCMILNPVCRCTDSTGMKAIRLLKGRSRMYVWLVPRRGALEIIPSLSTAYPFSVLVCHRTPDPILVWVSIAEYPIDQISRHCNSHHLHLCRRGSYRDDWTHTYLHDLLLSGFSFDIECIQRTPYWTLRGNGDVSIRRDLLTRTDRSIIFDCLRYENGIYLRQPISELGYR